jgi:hypothetical protein
VKISKRNIIIISIAVVILIAIGTICILSYQKNNLVRLHQEKAKIENKIKWEKKLIQIFDHYYCDQIDVFYPLSEHIYGSFDKFPNKKRINCLGQKVNFWRKWEHRHGEIFNYCESWHIKVQTNVSEDIKVISIISIGCYYDYTEDKIYYKGHLEDNLSDEQIDNLISSRDDILSEKIKKEKTRAVIKIQELELELAYLNSKISAINTEINSQIGL